MARVIQESRPTWVLGENVAGLVTMGLDDMLSDLESFGYATQTLCIPACALNAKHRRDRVWIMAHSEGIRGRSLSGRKRKEKSERFKGCNRVSWWQVEPDVARVAHGIPSRVDRLKGLGNAIVPQVAYEIIKAME